MSAFLTRLLSVLPLVFIISVSARAQSDGSLVGRARLERSYPSSEFSHNATLAPFTNPFQVAGTLTIDFNQPYSGQTGFIRNDSSRFQKNLLRKFHSPKSVAFRRAVTVPVLLTAAGWSFLEDDNDDNYEVQWERNRYMPNFHSRADDYLQYAPIVAVYGLNWMGVEGKNDFANRTAILIRSEVMVGVITYSLKRLTAVPRPDTKQPTSFPSGHTAQAFAAATFMAKEYGHRSVWYSVGAYTVATGVGAMRIMNNRHWLSDVLAGAGIGILSTNLAYLTHRYRWGKKSNRGQTSVIPSYDGQAGMVSIIHRFD